MSINKLGPGMALASLKSLFSDQELRDMYHGKRIGTIDIEIMDRCNFKCVYCYTNSDACGTPMTGKRLTAAEMANIIDQAADMDIRLLNLQGGEPILDKKLFFQLAEYARPKFKSLVAFTNGSTLNEEDIKRIAGLNMALCVKMDTMKDDIAFRLTGRQNVITNLLPVMDLLKKYKVAVTTNSVATPLNYYDIPNVWKYDLAMGFTPFVARNHYHGRTRDNKTLQLSAVYILKRAKT